MKKTLSLILAVLMLFGCMSVTAFADGNTTDITATVPNITYNIVIPAKTALTEENHTDILLGGDTGKATVEITAHPSDTVNIYYTVDLTAGDLTDGDGHTITTSYTYAQGGDYSALTADTKVTVYTGGKVVDSTIKVTADDTEWMAAPSGDYNATVTFNFAKEEVPSYLPASAVDGYYLVGKFNGTEYWSASGLTTQMLLTANELAAGEYTIDWDFDKNDGIKVAKVESGSITQWYKDGIDTEYNINEEQAGPSTVHFRPEGNAEWSYFYLTVQKK